MSDGSLSDEVLDRTLRAHRCQPRNNRPGKPRLGDRYHCTCGVDYQYNPSTFGGLWLPITKATRP